MKIIREISSDIKCKIKNANKNIMKANWYKNDYPDLAENYYNFSVNDLEEILSLHEEVVILIEEYEKENQPPQTMLTIWDYQHKEILEEVAEIKALQEMYKKL